MGVGIRVVSHSAGHLASVAAAARRRGAPPWRATPPVKNTAYHLKTALGMSKDESYLNFMAQTGRHRQAAFNSFVLCIGSFSVGFLVDLLVRMRSTPILQMAVLVLGASGCARIGRELGQLMGLATELIFKQPT